MNTIELEDERDFLQWRQGSGTTIEIYDIVVGSERRQGKGRRLIERLFTEVMSSPYVDLVWAIT